MGTNVSDPIATALFPGSRRAVLGILYGSPDRAFYLREIIGIAGLGVGQIQRELNRLSKAGIIRRFEQGRHVYFQADDSCPTYEELRSLVLKSVGALGVVRNALEKVSDRIRVAFVYGSIAHGEERQESDLDLLVVGDISFGELVDVLLGAETLLGREVHPTVFSEEEFRSRIADRNHFLESVTKGQKVFAIGNEHDLGELLK